LYSALRRGARAIFQFYPENEMQIQMIMTAATKVGFTGGLVVDYPNSKSAKKYYLCLFTGGSSGESQKLPEALDDETNGVKNTTQQVRERRGRKPRAPIKDKNWVIRKKELARKRGFEVANDSKYTSRKRKPRF
jgi:18S rRNA (guanine1575-N7)-methyltransferase